MATYQYECKDCAVLFELTRSVHEEEQVPKCPECQKDMRKVFHAPTVNLVGRGFYRNGG